MIKTTVYIERVDTEQDTVEVRKVVIPTNNPTGAHSKYEFQLVAGRLKEWRLLSETLFQEMIKPDEWKKIVASMEGNS